MKKIALEDFPEHAVSKLTSLVEEEIFTGINRGLDFVSMDQLDGMREMSWLNKLASSVLRGSALVEQVIRTKLIDRSQIEIKISRGTESKLSAILEIRGIGDSSAERLRAMFYGGEVQVEGKEEKKEKVVFDAHTTVNVEKMQRAADELRDYFVERFEGQLGLDLEEELKKGISSE